MLQTIFDILTFTHEIDIELSNVLFYGSYLLWDVLVYCTQEVKGTFGTNAENATFWVNFMDLGVYFQHISNPITLLCLPVQSVAFKEYV